MTLEKYISEAVSHGRKSTYEIDDYMTPEYISRWLTSLGLKETDVADAGYGDLYTVDIDYPDIGRHIDINALLKVGQKKYSFMARFSPYGNKRIERMQILNNRTYDSDELADIENATDKEYEEVMKTLEKIIKKKK